MKTCPENCAECGQCLTVGLAFYVLACHLHAKCAECDNSNHRNHDDCCYCRKQKKEIETRRKRESLDARNSLPLIQITDTAGLSAGPASLKYQYPPLHQTPLPRSLSYAGYFTLQDEAKICWPAGYEDYIIVGGMWAPTLTVVTPSGNMIQHQISRGKYITSGLFIKPWIYIVCVGYTRGSASNAKVHLLSLDPTSTTSSVVHPLATFDICNPVHLFNISKQSYGVLCVDRPYSFTSARIRILDLGMLILALDIDPRTSQSLVLRGKRTLIHLDLPEPFYGDIVAVTPMGKLCILSKVRSKVRVYNRRGAYMYTIGKNYSELHKLSKRPGELYTPKSIQCTADNTLVITGYSGDVQCYDLDSISGVIVRKLYNVVDKYERYECSDDEPEYGDDGKRKVYLYNDNRPGWRLVKSRGEGEYVKYSTMTFNWKWVIDNSEQTILHTYIVNS